MNDADYIGLDVQVPSGLQIVRRATNCAIQYRHLGTQWVVSGHETKNSCQEKES